MGLLPNKRHDVVKELAVSFGVGEEVLERKIRKIVKPFTFSLLGLKCLYKECRFRLITTFT